ncbi:Aldehyde dehydrogenase, partial [Operophtera brumata]
LFIDNEWVPAKSGKTFKTYTPHDGSVIAEVAEGGKRGNILRKFAELVERDSEYLIELESLNNGMLMSMARAMMQSFGNTVRYIASLADKIQGDTIPLGCTAVVKPAEQTPLTALVLAALLKEAGLPKGVVNVVNGFGEDAGVALTHHPKVDETMMNKVLGYIKMGKQQGAKLLAGGNRVGTTGYYVEPTVFADVTDDMIIAQEEVGKLIQKAAGTNNLKRVTLELGGKSQMCVAASRLYVQSGIYDKFVEAAVKHAKSIKIGKPTDPTSQHGPQVDETMMNKVLGYIKMGKQQGAKLLAGGNRVGTTGYYVEPTVFADVTDDMIIAQEEIFGPVQSILKFETLEEVVDRANATNYGLAAGIFTTNINNALQFSKHVEAGTRCSLCGRVPGGEDCHDGATKEALNYYNQLFID